LNYFACPIKAPDKILSKFPTIKTLICEIDPLRDSSIKFMLKLKKLGVDAEILLMKNHIHGSILLSSLKNGIP
jgi:acetyl esterase/lipase